MRFLPGSLKACLPDIVRVADTEVHGNSGLTSPLVLLPNKTDDRMDARSIVSGILEDLSDYVLHNAVSCI